MESSPPPFPPSPSPPTVSDLDDAGATETSVAGRRKRPLSTILGSVPAATDFTNFVRDVVGITRDVVMVAPKP